MDNRSSRPADQNRQVRRPVNGQPQRRPAAQGGQPQRQPQRQPKRSGLRQKEGGRWFRAIVMVLATVVGCVFIALFILNSAQDLFGLNQDDIQIEVTIPENATRQQVATILAEAGVVDQQLTFSIYANIKKDEMYHAGEYLFNTNMGYDEILRDLRTGDTQKEEVTIMFVEGENVYEIAKKLEDNGVCDADKFLEHLESEDFGYSFMDQMPSSGLRFRKLEGYLFPDTYDFYVGENVDNVARKFLRNFEDKITDNMRTKMMDLNLSLDEAITLASIIQKEASTAIGIDEMKRVSSVFHNRLDLKEEYPNLQSDVTREYVNRFIKPFHNNINQDMYDAYNTYVREGLPVGPICNPGMDAIMAALYPADTPYYFFVTDVNERFYYAETASQHYEYVRIASAVEGEGEIHGTNTDG